MGWFVFQLVRKFFMLLLRQLFPQIYILMFWFCDWVIVVVSWQLVVFVVGCSGFAVRFRKKIATCKDDISCIWDRIGIDALSFLSVFRIMLKHLNTKRRRRLKGLSCRRTACVEIHNQVQNASFQTEQCKYHYDGNVPSNENVFYRFTLSRA